MNWVTGSDAGEREGVGEIGKDPGAGIWTRDAFSTDLNAFCNYIKLMIKHAFTTIIRKEDQEKLDRPLSRDKRKSPIDQIKYSLFLVKVNVMLEK